MKVTVEFSIDSAAFEEDLPQQVFDTLVQAAGKAVRQLGREPGCICTHNEADDVLKDANGNTIGTVAVTEG